MTPKICFPTIFERNKFITSQKKQGTSNAQISTKVGLSIRQIQRIYATAQKSKRYKRKTGSGRLPALSTSDKIRISKQINKNPYISCPKLKQALNIKAHEKTIYRYIKSVGLTYKKASKKPELTERHINGRLSWAKMHQRKSWKRVIFSDETTFVLNQSLYGWSLPGRSIKQKSLTYNPRVQVWGSISSKGKVYFTIFEGTMTSEKYIKALKDGFLQKSRELFGNNWTLQQDVAKAHTAKITLKLFQQEKIKVLEWPPRSPNLSPIENLWSFLKRAVYQRNPKNVDELKKYIEEEIRNFSDKKISKLVNSMSDRVEMVIESGGNNIDY